MGVQRPAHGGADQRRSPRHKIKLPIELHEGSKKRSLHTVDVSRHGLFIATDDPPRERFLLQLSVKIPTGALPATAFVARTMTTGPNPGVGVQFFALSAQSKERWDAFIFHLSGMAVPPSTGDLSTHKPDVATFLIKLKDSQRLLEFYEKNVRKGGLYMATPVIKEAGADVGLVVIHPITEQEYFLAGVVERVCTTAPKGMEIKFTKMTRERKAHFLEYVTTGVGPEIIEPAPPPIELRKQIDQLPLVTEDPDSEDISIDIVVDDEALEDSEHFAWDEVSLTSGVLTFDIAVHNKSTVDNADTDDLIDHKKKDLVPEIDLAPPPRRATPLEELPIDVATLDGSRDLDPPLRPRSTAAVARNTAGLYEIPAESVPVHVYCSGCGTSYGTAELGNIGGPLGLVASRHPYWCKYEDQIVSVVRLNSPLERRMMARHLGDAAREQPTPLSALFDVADLAERPRCPSCGGDVRADGVPKAIALVIDDVRSGTKSSLGSVKCPSCREAKLIAAIEDD